MTGASAVLRGGLTLVLAGAALGTTLGVTSLSATGTRSSHGRAGGPEGADRAPLWFGKAVAVAGDELLVGRPGISARPGALLGGVHVFRRDAAGRWRETAVLAPRTLARGDDFGAALAVDGRRLAVGAPQAQGGRGAVYLFERDARGRWVERAVLRALHGTPADQLGAVLALRGDVLVAGAPGAQGGRGHVVLFRRRAAAGPWREQATLASPDPDSTKFGTALAVAGRHVFVSAASPSAPGGRGQVVAFRDSSGTWVPEARLVAPEGKRAGDWFGTALLAEGDDSNGAGSDRAGVWIASPADNGGLVFLFRRAPSGQWAPAARLEAAAGAAAFGTALARAGAELLVGAPGSDNWTGAVYVFRRDAAAATWREVQRLAPADSTTPADRTVPRLPASASFGARLAAGRDVAVVGLAQLNRNDGMAMAFTRDAATEQWGQTATLRDTAWSTRQPLTGRAVPCRHGVALIFQCQHVELLAFLPLGAIGADTSALFSNTSGVWGWTDSATGREFALVGRSAGTAFVEVTDPVRPRYLGSLPLHEGARPSAWRDVKVYKNHAFIVADNTGPQGLQVFDLTRLRDVKGAPAVFTETAHYTRVRNVHTIDLDTVTGYAYLAGANGGEQSCGGGLHMVDVRTPTQPTFAGCYVDSARGGAGGVGYVHETTCVVYRGPDQAYRGHEVCFNAAGDAVDIVDVTDKGHPRSLGVATYPRTGFAHQGWLSEDQRYFFLDDEFDEGAQAEAKGVDQTRTRTIVFDIAALADPVVATEYYGPTAATDHNLYVRGRYMYQSNYRAGLRIVDVKDPRHPSEVGYFDTTPEGPNTPGFEGTWTNYPYFRSGAVATTSIGEGLFLLRYRGAAGAK